MYETVAHKYDLLHSDKDYEKESIMIKRYVDDHDEYSKIETILDVGCGTCNHLEYLLDSNVSYAVGIDVSQSMIDEAKRKKIENLTLLCGDVKDLSLDIRFDLCVSIFNIINHVSTFNELSEFFAAIKTNLKEGGFFIFDCINAIAAFADPPSDRKILKKTHDGTLVEVKSTVETNFMNSEYVLKNELIIDENQSFTYELRQTLWTPKIISSLLAHHGFDILLLNKHFSLDAATDTDYKICFMARKR